MPTSTFCKQGATGSPYSGDYAVRHGLRCSTGNQQSRSTRSQRRDSLGSRAMEERGPAPGAAHGAMPGEEPRVRSWGTYTSCVAPQPTALEAEISPSVQREFLA